MGVDRIGIHTARTVAYGGSVALGDDGALLYAAGVASSAEVLGLCAGCWHGVLGRMRGCAVAGISYGFVYAGSNIAGGAGVCGSPWSAALGGGCAACV